MTVTGTSTIRASQIATLDAAEAERLCGDMGRALADLLRELSAEEWAKPTDCEL